MAPPPTGSERTRIPQFDAYPVEAVLHAEEQPEPVVMYGGRDILDLFSNIRYPGFVPAQLPTGPITMQTFYNNASVYSRLANERLPPHVTLECPGYNCGYVMPVYYPTFWAPQPMYYLIATCPFDGSMFVMPFYYPCFFNVNYGPAFYTYIKCIFPGCPCVIRGDLVPAYYYPYNVHGH